MSVGQLALAYLRKQWLMVILNVLLLSLGLALMVMSLLSVHQAETALTRDAQGIDLVVGAKGSPLQLILSGVYHLDLPTGNIRLDDAQTLTQNPVTAPWIQRAIPLSLGDSFRGYRIVGTTPEYLALYGAKLAQGQVWNDKMQAVLGSEVARSTGLTLQQSFVGGHGLTPGGAQHDDAPYQVVGVLQATGTVLDRLILVNSESVWFVHEGEVTDAEEKRLLQAEREITLLLITYRSPLAATRLPRIINADSAMQAAAPAAETARLFELLAPLLATLRALALALVIMGALALFVTLYRATEERRYDLAILRLMGASRHQLFALVCLEAALMAMAGCLLGLALGHAGTQVLGWVAQAQGGLPLSAWIFMPEELWLVAGTLMIALLAACLPAWRAASAPVSLVLSQH